MAFRARKVPDALVFALVAARKAAQELKVSAEFHADITQLTTGDYKSPAVTNDTVTAANATDLATALTLVNDTRGVVTRHIVNSYAHDTAVSAALTLGNATDLTSAVALANDIKDKYNTHRTATNVHFNDDSTNAVTNANATDQATLETLLNEMKGDVNAHVTSAPAGYMVEIVDA